MTRERLTPEARGMLRLYGGCVALWTIAMIGMYLVIRSAR